MGNIFCSAMPNSMACLTLEVTAVTCLLKFCPAPPLRKKHYRQVVALFKVSCALKDFERTINKVVSRFKPCKPQFNPSHLCWLRNGNLSAYSNRVLTLAMLACKVRQHPTHQYRFGFIAKTALLATHNQQNRFIRLNIT